MHGEDHDLSWVTAAPRTAADATGTSWSGATIALVVREPYGVVPSR
ncbi:hypothetical protein STANM309S_02870 [Streptomyces tanashiensis]